MKKKTKQQRQRQKRLGRWALKINKTINQWNVAGEDGAEIFPLLAAWKMNSASVCGHKQFLKQLFLPSLVLRWWWWRSRSRRKKAARRFANCGAVFQLLPRKAKRKSAATATAIATTIIWDSSNRKIVEQKQSTLAESTRMRHCPCV